MSKKNYSQNIVKLRSGYELSGSYYLKYTLLGQGSFVGGSLARWRVVLPGRLLKLAIGVVILAISMVTMDLGDA
jgi:hypothetical protein